MEICTPELHPIPVVSTWYHKGIDFMGPLHHKSLQGSRYIMTISDYFSKFVLTTPCKTKEAVNVADVLYKVCKHLLYFLYVYRLAPE